MVAFGVFKMAGVNYVQPNMRLGLLCLITSPQPLAEPRIIMQVESFQSTMRA